MIMELEKEIAQSHFKTNTHKLGVNIIYTFNWLNAIHSKFIKPYGITAQQYNVLRILRGQNQNPANIKLIKERMLDKMSDASRIVEKLRTKGLVNRITCENDRRSCEVTITDKGLELLAKIDRYDDFFAKTFSNLKSEEIDQLNVLLDKMRG